MFVIYIPVRKKRTRKKGQQANDKDQLENDMEIGNLYALNRLKEKQKEEDETCCIIGRQLQYESYPI